MLWVNDVHSTLNHTPVASIERPSDLQQLQALVRSTSRLSLCGGRHAMGGQAFSTNELLLDMTALKSVLWADCERGLLCIEAGAMWPDVILASHQMSHPAWHQSWGIRQKQTGVDDVSVGGSVSANAHGRGLQLAPLVEDIEALDLVLADGELIHCSRSEHSDLFALACGGYGLFGVIYAVTLRLCVRQRMERLVDILDVDDAAQAVYRRVQQGCLYGDFQFAIDAEDQAFLSRGVFSCYRPLDAPDDSECAGAMDSDFQPAQWLELLRLAHTDKKRAFATYAQHYLATHGQRYWSDTLQLATYLPSYAEYLSQHQPQATKESLMIGEHYVPQEHLLDYMKRARRVLLEHGSEVVYGTIRAIEPDHTTFLPWAKSAYCCIVFNLRTVHSAEGIARSARSFRGLIDAALDLEGSFYLTYHRWWTKAQLIRAYPKIEAFIQLKRRWDPNEKFSSDWYRHLTRVLNDAR
jgi:FAD/FMN-containing dehydrogenase